MPDITRLLTLLATVTMQQVERTKALVRTTPEQFLIGGCQIRHKTSPQKRT